MNDRRTLLVPIDEFGIDRASLNTLIDTAHLLDRTVLVLLLENPRLHQVAELAFTTEVSEHSGEERQFKEEQLRARAGRKYRETQRQMQELATAQRLPLRFESSRGERLHSALSRDHGLDIWLPRRPRDAHRSRAASGVSLHIGAVLADVEEDTAVLAAAGALTRQHQVADIYVHAASHEGLQRLAAMDLHGARLHRQTGMSRDALSLMSLIRLCPYDLLIMPRSLLSGINPTNLEQAINSAPGQVLLVS